MRQLFSEHRFSAPSWAPFFLRLALRLLMLGSVGTVAAADDVVVRRIAGSDFSSAREALVEAIEAEGLVVGAVLPFNRMLERTAGVAGPVASPYAEAEIVQFCSSDLAWRMVGEEASQLALCPLSIALYRLAADPGPVVLAYRRPGNSTPGRIRAEELLRRLVERAGELARLRW